MFEIRFRHWKHGRRSVRTIKMEGPTQDEARANFLATVPANQVAILSVFEVEAGDELAETQS